jgi:LPXTG-site transpeptidase (sortase) family protein
VEIPSIDVVLPVVPVGVADDGQMALPRDPDIGGWYRYGPGPASEAGASVISAHVDSRDEVGPLAKLPRLDRGDRVLVTVDGARAVYVVDRVDQYAKTALDTDALFSRSGPPRLHLVSCGGEWNPRTRHYEDNVVVIARRASLTDGVAYREAGGE